jgi:pimeloyl-ACP methyl ester carboxylesterase
MTRWLTVWGCDLLPSTGKTIVLPTRNISDRGLHRWGLGRTQTPHQKSARGISEWASVVNEVLDQLGIEQCSVMAHSAGSPYALAFANRYRHRVRGDICLLAPWVGEGGEQPMRSNSSTTDDRHSRLQMAEVRSQRSSQDRTGCGVEGSGLDAGETSNGCVRRYRVRFAKGKGTGE